MLSPCLISSKTGRRVVLDGGVGVGFLPAAMAAGVLQAGALEGAGEVVEELQGDVAKLMVSSIGVEQGREQVLHYGRGGGGWRSTAIVGESVWCTRGPIGGVVELHGAERSLPGVLLWRGRARSGLPTVNRRRRRNSR
jgi:hypothetical protein